MNSLMVLTGDSGGVALEILHYENLQAISVEDLNWLRVRLQVQGGQLSGKAEFGMTTDELALLHSELSAAVKTLNGTVQYSTMEGNWHFNVEFERSGTAMISGILTPSTAIGNALHFVFESDPISVESALDQLSHLLKAYPRRTLL